MNRSISRISTWLRSTAYYSVPAVIRQALERAADGGGGGGGGGGRCLPAARA